MCTLLAAPGLLIEMASFLKKKMAAAFLQKFFEKAHSHALCSCTLCKIYYYVE